MPKREKNSRCSYLDTDVELSGRRLVAARVLHHKPERVATGFTTPVLCKVPARSVKPNRQLNC